MRQELGRLIRMTNDLLLLARSDVGLEMRHEPVELDTLLLEVLRELRPLATVSYTHLDVYKRQMKAVKKVLSPNQYLLLMIMRRAAAVNPRRTRIRPL